MKLAKKQPARKCGNYAWRRHISIFVEYAWGTLITGMKTESFQKTGGFEPRSEATLLVSLPDFVDKIYVKQKT